jgi:hypothetical protein
MVLMIENGKKKYWRISLPSPFMKHGLLLSMMFQTRLRVAIQDFELQ